MRRATAPSTSGGPVAQTTAANRLSVMSEYQQMIARRMSVKPQDVTALLADSDPSACRTLVDLLENVGHDVVVVMSAQALLQNLTRSPDKFQLLLISLNLPDMEGVKLVEEIRQIDGFAYVPVIVLSEPEGIADAYHCIRSGADDFLIKPVKVDMVANIWQNLWRKRKEKQVLQLLDEERVQKMKMKDMVSKLQDDVAEATETPIHAITRIIKDLMDSQSSSISREAREALGQVLKSLHSSDLYRPVLDKVLGNDDMDNQTKDWLMHYVYGGSDDASEVYGIRAHSLKQSGSMIFRSCFELNPSGGTARQARLQLLGSWDFDVWSYTPDELITFLEDIFEDLGLTAKFEIGESELHSLLLAVRQAYRGNPYHNFRHAFDVTHAGYLLLRIHGAKSVLSSLETLALMVACLTHDLEHPGLNNTYQVVTMSPLALRYNDQSVLENMHCQLAFELFTRPDLNIFKKLSPAMFRDIRKLIIECILATDLSQHVDLVAKFTALAPNFSRENPRDRIFLLKMLIKCADVSNPLRELHVAKYWTDMISEEQFLQGDREREEKLAISPFMDRENAKTAEMSVSFLDYIVTPLYSSVIKVVVDMESLLVKLARTREYWQRIVEEKMMQLSVDDLTIIGEISRRKASTVSNSSQHASATPANTSTNSVPLQALSCPDLARSSMLKSTEI